MREWTADLQLFVTFRLSYVKRFLGRDRQIKGTSGGACGRGPLFYCLKVFTDSFLDTMEEMVLVQ